MAPEVPSPGLPNKRQKLNNSLFDAYDKSEQPENSVHLALEKAKASAFDFESLPNDRTANGQHRLPIAHYIPAGCIRLCKEDVQLPMNVWTSQDYWAAFSATRDVYNKIDFPFLHNTIQDLLLKSPILSPYETLFKWGFVRAEFKVNDEHLGQVRIYLLENRVEDHENQVEQYQKSIRKGLKHLLRNLDISNHTWLGKWTKDVPISHIDTSLNEGIESIQDETLLGLFNSLPSPDPKRDVVENPFAKASMTELLSGEVFGLQTAMYPYQRRSAALMVQRETFPGLVIDPRLNKMLDQRDTIWYGDPEAPYISRGPRMYDAPRGGILAENMGLGKTLICLALILATRAQPTAIPPEHSVGLVPVRKKTGSLMEMAAAALGRHAMPWKEEVSSVEAQGYNYAQVKEAIKAQPGHYFILPPPNSRPSRAAQLSPQKILLSACTLVVVPANLLQQWINEINKHTKGLKVLVMRDMHAKVPPAIDILDYDVLLFTKGRFDKEARSGHFNNSPLRSVHFKRLIYDEGHTFGSASNSSQTEAFTLVNALQISARWIVSGTPAQGLYSTGVSGANTPLRIPESDNGVEHNDDRASQRSVFVSNDDKLFVEQERKDLIRLGNIAMYFLKVRPWAHSPDGDVATWQHYALQPRHGEKSHGNIECLRTTLEGMMVRHRLCDIDTDVKLPPLYEAVVPLEPCLQNKFALNTFNLMIITNAVTSERRDADYFFHPKQAKNLQALVSNLRQASFFWSGFEIEHLKGTIAIAQSFLDENKVPTSADDVALLKEAIEYGKTITANNIFQKITEWHEMPMYIENNWPDIMKSLLSMDDAIENPTLMSPGMVFDAQKYHHKTAQPTPRKFIIEAHRTLLATEKAQPSKHSSQKGKSNSGESRKSSASGPMLAGGVIVGQDPSPKKLSRSSVKKTSVAQLEESELRDLSLFEDQLILDSSVEDATLASTGMVILAPNQDNSESRDTQLARRFDSLLDQAHIISTASTKLSYLLDRILRYQGDEKILVFYEDSNTAYYIAQYLECLNIKHLIYAKELTPEKRSRYVATFNTTETFRVLLMDVSQAAFGLDVSSASRVFFINPVFSPQVEAQAVKRAHRIGQDKPVYVETLVLKGSIEEVLVARRDAVSKEEHQKFKSVLDDQTIYDWIRNTKLLAMVLEPIPGPLQMAPLEKAHKLFAKGSGSGYGANPDADIVKTEHILPDEKDQGEKRNNLESRRQPASEPPTSSYSNQEHPSGSEWTGRISPKIRQQMLTHLPPRVPALQDQSSSLKP